MTDREIKTQWLGRGRPLRLRLIGLYAERAERRSRAEYAGIRYDGTSGASGNATERRLDANVNYSLSLELLWIALREAAGVH